MKVVISENSLDITKVFSEIGKDGCGSVVIFTGIVRGKNRGKEVIRLEYEVYKEMAEDEIMRICEEAKEKFGLKDAVVIHRIGILYPGEVAVVVAVSSGHRKEGFEGCKYIIDEIKKRVPIWKKEVFVDGEEWVE